MNVTKVMTGYIQEPRLKILVKFSQGTRVRGFPIPSWLQCQNKQKTSTVAELPGLTSFFIIMPYEKYMFKVPKHLKNCIYTLKCSIEGLFKGFSEFCVYLNSDFAQVQAVGRNDRIKFPKLTFTYKLSYISARPVPKPKRKEKSSPIKSWFCCIFLLLLSSYVPSIIWK